LVLAAAISYEGYKYYQVTQQIELQATQEAKRLIAQQRELAQAGTDPQKLEQFLTACGSNCPELRPHAEARLERAKEQQIKDEAERKVQQANERQRQLAEQLANAATDLAKLEQFLAACGPDCPDALRTLAEAGIERLKQQQRQADAAHEREASVTRNADVIFNSPRQIVLGNKDGDVTFVEFFDYNCGYCKRAMADMLALVKNDNKLKVVLKEFPVLGEGSVEAARVAVAVRMQDPTGQKYLDFHQKLLGGRGPADRARAMAAAKDARLDIAKIEKDLSSPEVRVTIEENLKLAEEMGLNGTPSYVIGKQIVVGAIGLEGLKEKIGIARCGKATC
jgi:protein-disulfide isomerase